jgi:hypothetical protein
MTDKKSTRFTFDSDNDGAVVPTLTSLLYRRNSVKTKTSPLPTNLDVTRTNIGEGVGGGMPGLEGLAPFSTAAMQEETEAATQMNPSPFQGSSNASESAPDAAVVQTPFSPPQATRTLQSTPGKPIGRIIPSPLQTQAQTQPQTFENYPAAAPLSQGIKSLQKKTKLRSSLIFEADSSGTTFSLKSILGQTEITAEREAIWSGMTFSTTEFSDLWGRLKKFGFAEFSTLGAAGQGNYDRVAFRSAFQASNQEWLTLARSEHNGKETLIALLSEGSIQAQLPALLTDGKQNLNRQAA